jgi:TolB protein
MDADGNNREKLVDPGAQPSWSPDGRKIAFMSWVPIPPPPSEMHVIGADGQGLKRVTHDLTDDWSPAFSPDGRRIAYVMTKARFPGQIYVVGRDGKNRVRLTHNKEHHGSPAWSPDGRIIAYMAADGRWPDQWTIHLMTADGKYLRQLSDDRGGARDFGPDISPLGLAVSPASKTTTTWGRLKKSASDLR